MLRSAASASRGALSASYTPRRLAVRSFASNPTSLFPSQSQPPPPPSSHKPSKTAIKTLKPSSKVNARTSRLLRSQLRAPDGTPQKPVSEEEAAHQAALQQDALLSRQPAKLQQVIAHATASMYDFTALVQSGRLPPDWQLLEDGQVIYLPSWPVSSHPGPASYTSHRAGSGEVFILRSGAYVTWGINAEQSKRFRSLVLSPRQEKGTKVWQVEQGAYEDLGEEEMEFVRDEDEVTRVVGDVLIIGRAPPEADPESPTYDDPWSPLLARLSFSAGLALSARLSSQETSLSTYLASVQRIPRLLEEKGRVPISRREVVRKMGRLLKLRQMVNLEEGSKVEELELFWENARMEQHYDSICTTLDIESRFRSLNEQLDHAENLMGVLRALLTEGSSHRMELVIIALIAVEVALALSSHLPKLWADDEDEEEQGAEKTRRGTGGALVASH